ncbi:MAG: hypothetical protein DME23_15040 [Verrucomicrobia bacterium]|nr:MAG: hypothetical protein DME23_15040 [Verrucomicrobiota bacterium]
MKVTNLCLFCFCALAGVILAGAGCKSSGREGQVPSTQSGLPEVTLEARPAREIQAVARAFFLGRGYVETASQHAYELVFDKPTRSGSSRALRVRLRLARQADGSWRLLGRPMGVEAWRSDLESEQDVPNGAGQIQRFLGEIKSRIEPNR